MRISSLLLLVKRETVLSSLIFVPEPGKLISHHPLEWLDHRFYWWAKSDPRPILRHLRNCRRFSFASLPLNEGSNKSSLTEVPPECYRSTVVLVL